GGAGGTRRDPAHADAHSWFAGTLSGSAGGTLAHQLRQTGAGTAGTADEGAALRGAARVAEGRGSRVIRRNQQTGLHGGDERPADGALRLPGLLRQGHADRIEYR